MSCARLCKAQQIHLGYLPLPETDFPDDLKQGTRKCAIASRKKVRRYFSFFDADKKMKFSLWKDIKRGITVITCLCDRVLSMGKIELKCVLMLNSIPWNWTVLTFKLRDYAKLSCLKWNCIWVINWIVWNRIAFIFYIFYILHCNHAKLNCLK